MKGKTGGKIIIDFAATGLKHKVMKYKKMIIKLITLILKRLNE